MLTNKAILLLADGPHSYTVKRVLTTALCNLDYGLRDEKTKADILRWYGTELLDCIDEINKIAED